MPPKPGEAMDASFGIAQGWWLTYPRVHLFMPPPNQPFQQIQLPSGESSFGFNMVELAQQFTANGMGQSPGDLINNAGTGGLTVQENSAVLPSGAKQIDFVFELPVGPKIQVRVTSLPIAGTA